ncbi:MAG: methyltransferase domain-containing protein [Candidatus Alcyoniella australis]|nr:methyltransferase domain-containing protein [Candidatus Alcyoniella australis]
MSCPACGGSAQRIRVWVSRSGRVVRCTDCGMVYSDPPAVPRELIPEGNKVADDPRQSMVNARRRLRWIARLGGPTQGRLLDVGCFDGAVTAAARRLGFEVTGLEPFAPAAEAARSNYGLNVIVQDVEHAEFADESFEVISLIHVFEHLPQPHLALERMVRWLTPGGVLALELPDSGSIWARLLGRGWRQYIIDHLRFYNRRVLLEMLRSHGLEVLGASKVGKRASLGLIADRIERYYWPRLGRGMGRWLGRHNLSNLGLTWYTGDIMFAVARKPVQGA